MPLKNLQDTILEHCWAQRGKCSQETSKRYCSVFLRPARKISLGSFQETILEHFWAQRGKCHQEDNRIPFWSISRRISRPNTENVSRKLQGHCFIAFLMCPGGIQEASRKHPGRPQFRAFLSPARKMPPGSFQDTIFGAFLGPTLKMPPGSKYEAILVHFLAQERKCNGSILFFGFLWRPRNAHGGRN